MMNTKGEGLRTDVQPADDGWHGMGADYLIEARLSSQSVPLFSKAICSEPGQLLDNNLLILCGLANHHSPERIFSISLRI